MPERTAYEPGTPSWVDLATPDLDAAIAFYSALFGWQTEAAGAPEETGGYTFFLLDGARVAGVSPIMTEGHPTAWSTYFSTDDADATAARATAAGANVVAGPMDIMTAGRMAFFMHPAAGAFGIWQPRDHVGAGRVNEPGALAWNELLSRDVPAAKQLLAAVFGISAQDGDFGGSVYSTLKLDGHDVGGMMAMPAELPAEVPSFWQPYFGVADADAGVVQVRELGGSVMMEPTDIPGIGRFATLTDPAGAAFSVVALARE